MARRKKFGASWSWKRASGLSSAKAKLSRQIGIPLTRAGRQRKLGKMVGCCIPLFVLSLACIGLVLGCGELPESRPETPAATYYQPKQTYRPPSTYTHSYSSDRVHVKGYYRKDGTYVRPHTRSKPRR